MIAAVTGVVLDGVAPHAGVWIEISTVLHALKALSVAPHAGVWIEIFPALVINCSSMASLPTRECGLKYTTVQVLNKDMLVAPHAGVWIEIATPLSVLYVSQVAPHAGVWIEID